MVTSEHKSSVEGVAFLTQDEARATFDKTARHVAGISGDEFLRRWDADQYGSLRKTDPIQYGRLRRLAEVRVFAR